MAHDLMPEVERAVLNPKSAIKNFMAEKLAPAAEFTRLLDLSYSFSKKVVPVIGKTEVA
jgi:hypothetical protein